MSITGHSWQQEQMFGMANNAVDQIGNASGGNGLIAGLKRRIFNICHTIWNIDAGE